MQIRPYNHHPNCNINLGFNCDCLVSVCEELNARLEKFENFFKSLNSSYISHTDDCVWSYRNSCTCHGALWLELKEEIDDSKST